MKKIHETALYAVGKDYIIPFLALVISFAAILVTQKNKPDYAIISKDAEVTLRKGMQKYGLFAEKKIENREKHEIPYYLISFENDPEYFEVTTRQNAVVEVNQIGPHEYRVQFRAVGYGNPIIECDFKIQAY